MTKSTKSTANKTTQPDTSPEPETLDTLTDTSQLVNAATVANLRQTAKHAKAMVEQSRTVHRQLGRQTAEAIVNSSIQAFCDGLTEELQSRGFNTVIAAVEPLDLSDLNLDLPSYQPDPITEFEARLFGHDAKQLTGGK